jgi:hypothetical protein
LISAWKCITEGKEGQSEAWRTSWTGEKRKKARGLNVVQGESGGNRVREPKRLVMFHLRSYRYKYDANEVTVRNLIPIYHEFFFTSSLLLLLLQLEKAI